jgi:DDE superfamily endonuclease
MDSAYPCTSRSIPVHKEPASLIPRNAVFDRYVSRLRVRSEHAMGALKGRFQCLRGLRLQINSKSDHVAACRWVTITIILHNIIVDLEGNKSAAAFAHVHTQVQEEED